MRGKTVNQDAVENIKRGKSSHGVTELIMKRWSPRAFSDREVSSEDLKGLFEAASWAASSYGEEPWRFLVGRKGDSTYQKIFDALVEFNQGWAKSAPVLFLSVGKKTFTQNGKENYHMLHDTGAATATFALEATSRGLHTHSMAGFDHDNVRESFGIPDDYVIGAVTALGYLGDVSTLPEGLRKQDESPRARRPLEQFVFAEWSKPASL
jgi:nitroreductase